MASRALLRAGSDRRCIGTDKERLLAGFQWEGHMNELNTYQNERDPKTDALPPALYTMRRDAVGSISTLTQMASLPTCSRDSLACEPHVLLLLDPHVHAISTPISNCNSH
ncbi:hypothetical protein RJT34_16792 [Clitoria ternatea]|uniref:Uncharacterized protein n=1 Tax=Clitoria ternatea TaxID=43366 RepID=A0AAN9PCM6_CLITE